MRSYALPYWIRFTWLRFVALLAWRSACPYCLRISCYPLRVCPTCEVGQCTENCYQYKESPDGEQCGCCEYPDG